MSKYSFIDDYSEGCHPNGGTSNNYHSVHYEDFQCQVCHSQSYNSCGACHIKDGHAEIEAFSMVQTYEKGNVITGDQVLAICAKVMKQKGLLKNNTVVSTVMSNIGFRIALKEMDIGNITADVGDRYVLREMIASGAVIGGEDSGHTIFLDHHTTGDGIISALQLLKIIIIAHFFINFIAEIMQDNRQIFGRSVSGRAGLR